MKFISLLSTCLVLLPVLLPAQSGLPPVAGGTSPAQSGGSATQSELFPRLGEAFPAAGGLSALSGGATPAQNVRGLDDVSKMLEASTSSMDVNSDEGTVSWKGRIFDIGTSRIFRSRFERYLNQSERSIESQAEYQALLDEVLNLLSPNNLTEGESVFTENIETAYRLLYKASEYPQDAGNSKVLAHMIYNSWRMRTEIRQAIRRLTEEERKALAQSNLVQNRMYIENERMRDSARMMKANEIDAYRALRGGTEYSDVKMEEERLTRMRAGMEISGTRLEVQIKLAQFQFQSQIIYFVLQRRFEHSLMASYFYRALFKGSAQQIQVGDQILARFFPQGDMIYTVEALEQISLEAINDIKSSMEAIEYSLEQGELHSAMERLQECFYLGEFLEPVATMPRVERQRILDYYRLLRNARELLSLKDYDRLLQVSDELLAVSNDSRFTEINSYVNNAKQISNLKLAEARHLMASNNFGSAQEALRQSTAAWPLNPNLTTLTENIFAQTDAMWVAVEKFSTALRNKDLRAIFNDRHEIGIGLANDPIKGAQLAEIIDSVGTVDLLLGQAKMLGATGNHNGALELVMQAERIMPDDREVLALKSQLMPLTSEFAKALQQASQLEQHGEYILSYSWYEKVKEIYPASQIAATAQQRLLPHINKQL